MLCLALIYTVGKNLSICSSALFDVKTKPNDFSIYRNMLYIIFPISILYIFVYLNKNHLFKIPSINDFIQYAVLAPFFEEIGFRKIIPRMVAPNRITTFPEWLLFSVFFALLHFGNMNIFYYMDIIIFSLYMYYVAKKTNSVVYGIAYHSLGNLLRLFYVL